MALCRIGVGLLLLFLAAGCAQSIQIAVKNAPAHLAPSASDVQAAANAIDAVARTFEFEKHPAEQWYLHRSQAAGISDVKYVAAYEHTAAKEYGRIYLFLGVSEQDGAVLVTISDLDAYHSSSFIASLQRALVLALTECFPEREIQVETHRGVSPLGP